jgi:hypothetical protein
LPLLTPPPPICRRLSLRPSPFVHLVHPASCPLSRLLASHTATSHLPAPPPLIAPSPPLVTPISGLSSGWLRRRLSSRRRHLSAASEALVRIGLNLIFQTIQFTSKGLLGKL